MRIDVPNDAFPSRLCQVCLTSALLDDDDFRNDVVDVVGHPGQVRQNVDHLFSQLAHLNNNVKLSGVYFKKRFWSPV